MGVSDFMVVEANGKSMPLGVTTGVIKPEAALWVFFLKQ